MAYTKQALPFQVATFPMEGPIFSDQRQGMISSSLAFLAQWFAFTARFSLRTPVISWSEVERLILGQRYRYVLRSVTIGFDLTTSQVLCFGYRNEGTPPNIGGFIMFIWAYYN